MIQNKFKNLNRENDIYNMYIQYIFLSRYDTIFIEIFALKYIITLLFVSLVFNKKQINYAQSI